MTPENQYTELDPSELKPNPINVTIYGEEKADQELVESISKRGQLEPLVITENKTIISGHRRWLALKEIGIKAKCRMMSFENDLDEKEALVEFNRQREKTSSQVYNEVKLLSSIYAERAKQRQLANLKQYENAVVPDLAQRTEIEDEGAGRTRDKLAGAIGVKRTTLEKIIEVGEKAESGDEVAKRTLKRLDSGEITTDAAHKIIKLNEVANSNAPESETAKILIDEVDSGSITPNKAMQQLKSSKEEHKERTEIQAAKAAKVAKIPPGIFTVILADPPLPLEDFMNLRVPAADDSVLFLWANAQSLKECLEVMDWWGFEYKSCAVLDKGTKGTGSWFFASHELLLLGTRGNWGAPENRFSSVISGKNHDCVYEIIEKMFAGQKYLELFAKNKRKGWGSQQDPIEDNNSPSP